jgi:hypothetical protein
MGEYTRTLSLTHVPSDTCGSEHVVATPASVFPAIV